MNIVVPEDVPAVSRALRSYLETLGMEFVDEKRGANRDYVLQGIRQEQQSVSNALRILKAFTTERNPDDDPQKE